MTQQTIVAMYDTAAHAEAAVRDLKAANIPSDSIRACRQLGDSQIS